MGAAMRAALPIIALSLLTACATPGDDRFPSLARRDAERVTGTAQPALPPPRPQAVPAETGSRLTVLRQQGLAAHRRFEQQQGRAATLTAAAQGAAVASESWAVAQVALAALDTARSEAMIALADLDGLYIAAAEAAAATDGSAELDAVSTVRDEVSGWIAAEDAALASLRGRLRS